MNADDLRRALAAADDLDAAGRWVLALAVWWGVLWRLTLVGGLLNVAASAMLGTGDVGETRAGNAVGGVVWLLVTLWAVRRLVRVPWPWVFGAWWALVWRIILVGGGLFIAASWALGTWGPVAGATPADLWVGVAAGLPVSLWAARGLVRVIERKYARFRSEAERQ